MVGGCPQLDAGTIHHLLDAETENLAEPATFGIQHRPPPFNKTSCFSASLAAALSLHIDELHSYLGKHP
jgi:hypothetical protein